MKKFTLVILISMVLLACKNSNEKIEKEVLKNTEIEIPINGNSGKIKNLYVGCGYNYKLDKSDIILNEPTNREIEQIKNLLTYSGIPMNFEVYSADISNAAAIIIDNKRYIIFDPKLFLFTDKLSNTYWSSMSILAHEIGHHLSGHTLLHGNDSHKSELEADKYSGFLLYKMGASLNEATISIKLLASEVDSESHPAKSKRISAIENGWNEASQQRYESAIPPPPADENGNGKFWGQDEFTIEDLIYPEAIVSNGYGFNVDQDNAPQIDGIIIDVTRSDPSGGHYAQIFNKESSNFNLEITVQLTSISHSQYGEKRKVGDREKFCIMEYWSEMNNIGISSLEAIVVPGRKIRFKPYYFGYGMSQIFYLKKLNR